MSERLIHIRPTDTGAWLVQPEGCEEPISEHPNETVAEVAALEHAAASGGGELVVHDRYCRVRPASLTDATVR